MAVGLLILVIALAIVLTDLIPTRPRRATRPEDEPLVPPFLNNPLIVGTGAQARDLPREFRTQVTQPVKAAIQAQSTQQAAGDLNAIALGVSTALGEFAGAVTSGAIIGNLASAIARAPFVAAHGVQRGAAEGVELVATQRETQELFRFADRIGLPRAPESVVLPGQR